MMIPRLAYHRAGEEEHRASRRGSDSGAGPRDPARAARSFDEALVHAETKKLVVARVERQLGGFGVAP